MSPNTIFKGFSKDTIDFLKGLKENNNKRWFEQNRDVFDRFVMPESKNFVTAMGEKLSTIAPGIVAIPKINQSIFRIYKDTRFSKDKRPYKTHLGILFWEGPNKKMENPGFYFHLEPDKLFLGSGLYVFPKQIIQPYRESVVHKDFGAALTKAIQTVQKNPEYHLGWKKYKRIPAGFDSGHPNADLLLFGGLGFDYQCPVPKEIFTKQAVNYCFEKFRDMSPIHNWLRELTERVARSK